MSKTVLLATAAAFVLTAGVASAADRPSLGITGVKGTVVVHKSKGAKTLYSQNSNLGATGIDSQNFTSTYSKTYNAAGADDFVVPKKSTWTISEVDVSGIFYNGSGPASSENGKAVKGGSFTNLNGTDNAGSYSIPLGKKGMKLKSGTYWVSVVANCGFLTGCGQWGWYLTSTVHGNKAVWENPGNGFGTGCTTWGTLDACDGYTGDFAFDLKGKAKK